MNKLLSRILALLLVLVLIVNISPIRVQASALPEVAGVVTKVIPFNPSAGAAAGGAALGAQVFGWVLLGLGLIVTTAQAIDLMNQYTEFSGELETSIYYYPDGSWSYGVDMNFVDRVRAWLFQEGILYLGPQIDTSMPASVVEALGAARANGCHYFYGTTLSGGYPFVAYCNASNCMYLYYIYGFYQLQCGNGGPHTFVYKDETSTWGRSDGIQIKDGKIYKVGENEPVQTTDDAIELGQIALPKVDIPSGYPEWHTNARPATNPDTDEEITVLPIPLNPSADPETQIGTLTQPDIWQGSIADPMPEPEPDPDPGTDTDPDGSLAQTPWDAVKKWFSDFFIPSGDITMYSLDLTELFPFCIPFDIFDLLSALRADPVAPVFELELDFGVTKAPITVDLSGWSDLASIIRILEVGLFCLGLALGTKELIGS